MKGIAIDRFGSADVLKIHDLPVPKINAEEILIAVYTAGVGTWDPWLREGGASKKKFPLVLGSDGAGIVEAKGSRVSQFKVGDFVYSYTYGNAKGGFYAQYVAVEASSAGRPPKGMGKIAAGAIPAIGLTALQGVDDVLGLRAGENVIVHGASGNVGCIAAQFAKARGARVLAVASGRDGVRFVRNVGVEDVIDGRRADIKRAARRFASDGIDAVLAFAGGKELSACLETLREGGRVAYPNGVEPAPKKRKGITIEAYDAKPGFREMERLTRAIEQYGLIVPIAEIYKLKDARKAHERIERGHVLGRVVLRVR